MVGKHRTNGVLFVPYAGMVATGVARQGNDGEPRLKRGYLQSESTRDALLDAGGLDVAEDVGDNTERKHFSQNPSGWIGI